MPMWGDHFMITVGPRGGLRVECTNCLWFWGFHDGQALSDVNTAARGHRCKSTEMVNSSSLEVLDMIRMREDSKR